MNKGSIVQRAQNAINPHFKINKLHTLQPCARSTNKKKQKDARNDIYKIRTVESGWGVSSWKIGWKLAEFIAQHTVSDWFYALMPMKCVSAFIQPVWCMPLIYLMFLKGSAEVSFIGLEFNFRTPYAGWITRVFCLVFFC